MFGNLYGDEDEDNGQSSGVSNNQTTNGIYKRSNLRKPTEKRSPYGFVGLLNQGATCYLNSLIQLLYMTPELKNELYTLTLEDFGLEPEEVKNIEENPETAQDKQVNNNINDVNSNSNNHNQTSNSDNNHMSSIIPNLEKPTNPNILKANSGGSYSKPKQQEEEFDYSILESDYFQNLLNFGFEEHKLIEGLKKFPHEHQQERLVDWILSWEDRIMMDTSAPVDAVGDADIDRYQGIGPLTKEQHESLKFTEDIYDRIVSNHELSSKSENLDAFFSESLLSPFDDFLQSKAIVLYDENQNSLFPSPQDKESNTTTTPTTTTTTTTSNTTTTTTSNSNNVNTTVVKKTNKKKGRRISYELQRLFSLLQSGDVYAISTEDLTKSFGWTDSQSLYQHDIHELNRILFDAIEHSIKNTKIENIFNELYKGSNIIRIVCDVCKTVRDREEFILDLAVSVKGSESVEESLTSFITPEILDGKNQYFCETCQAKANASYTQRLGKLPPILHMCLNRFDYDAQKGKRVKLHNRFEFQNTINLTPFTADYSTYEIKLNELKSNPLTTEDQINDFIKSNKPKDKIYDLFAVLIHSGGAFGGHYHSYIKDLLKTGFNDIVVEETTTNNVVKKDQEENNEENEKDKKSSFNNDNYTAWFDFNDSRVTPIKDRSIINQFGGKSECAYMLIYRDRDYNTKEILVRKDIPKHFEKEIMAFNTQLEKQRYTYETTINTMFLQPRFLEDFRIRDGFLYENQKVLSDLEQLETDHLTLQIDVSSTVDDLFHKIDQKYPEKILKLGGPSNYIVQEISIKDGKVTNIQQPIQPNSTMNIKKTGLREGSFFIIWKGEEESGLPVKPIHYQIKFYQQGVGMNNTKLFQLAISKDCKFKDLLQQISDLLQISIEDLLIYTSTNQALIRLEDDIDTPLYNRIHTGITLLVEMKPTESMASLIQKDFESNKNKIQIFVKDKFNEFLGPLVQPIAQSSQESGRVLCDPKDTVYQLKSIIFDELFSHISKNDWIEKTIIRKTTTGGYDGSACTDDSMLVKDTGISDSSLIIFEKGTPTKSSLFIRFCHYVDKVNQNPQEPLGISAPKSNTILQLKKDMLKLLDINPEYFSRYVLRGCDLFEKPTTIIGDEEQTLEESGISYSDLIVIEEGNLPTKDQIPLFIRLYNCSKETIQLQFPSSPILHLNPTYIPPITELYQIHNLGNLMVDRKQNLQAFKQLILKWDKFLNHETIKFNEDQNDIRLWLDEKLLNVYNKPLSKLHIQPESTITIEIFNKEISNNSNNNNGNVQEDVKVLPSPPLQQEEKDQKINQNSFIPPPILLYVHQRIPQYQCFQHPAKQLIFTGKLIPELVSLISKEFEIEEEFIKLFKFSPNQKINPWRTIEERSTMNQASPPTTESYPSASTGLVYGIELEKLMERQNSSSDKSQSSTEVPLILLGFVRSLVNLNALVTKDLFSEKIELPWLELEKASLDQDPSELTKINQVYLVAMLFKSWLRELPVPLIPVAIYSDIQEKSSDPWSVIDNQLDPLNRKVLHYIFDFLVEFLDPDFTSQSQMDIHQLAIDLTPALTHINVASVQRYSNIFEILITAKYKQLLEFESYTDSFINTTITHNNNALNTNNDNDNNNKTEKDQIKIIEDYSTIQTTTTTTTENIKSSEDNSSSKLAPPPPPPPMKKKGTSNKESNINNTTKINELRGKPYLLKDGDIIAFIDSRDDPDNTDKFAMSSIKSFDSFGSTKYSKISNGEKYSVGGSGSSQRTRVKEVELKIEFDDY